MIERFALQYANRVTLGVPTGEHQRRPWCGMSAETSEHGALIIGREVKKAVPGEQPCELLAKIKLSHICKTRRRAWQVALEQREHGGGAVRPCHTKAAPTQLPRKRHAGAAANIEHRSAGGKETAEVIQPRLLRQAVAAVLGPYRSMAPVNVDHGIFNVAGHIPSVFDGQPLGTAAACRGEKNWAWWLSASNLPAPSQI